ncbi:glycosyl transferase family 11 [Klebsormidium nitens]|uniref:Glycosyl transferase family 11 n=1 Tax=Klebsormidium nitens TaxID=105231 RepID=A0A1Y1I8S4_KLENI|nr:glycosyl transferase family 11 [Klebsormidium nitens]|eukprot:GAQ85096.1 glycosyl transferase family 11 [Klebsormidium nitens]
MRIVNVHVQGGLGNRLFQVLFGLAQARRYGAEFRISSASRNPHSALDYFDGLLAQFRPFVKPAGRIDRVIGERPDDVWRRIAYGCPFTAGVESVMYVGYFQSHHHFEDVVDRRRLSDMLGTAAAKARMGEIYPDATSKGLFVHVRRGDYKSPAHSVHDLDLRAYYERALRMAGERLPSGFRLYVVSDDIRHCKDDHVFRAFDDVVFVEGLDEVDTLYLMAACSSSRFLRAGGNGIAVWKDSTSTASARST